MFHASLILVLHAFPNLFVARSLNQVLYTFLIYLLIVARFPNLGVACFSNRGIGVVYINTGNDEMPLNPSCAIFLKSA